MSNELFDATSFYEKEIDDWVTRQNTRRSMRLWARDKKDIELCRKRVLSYAQRNEIVIETERISDSEMEIRYTGNLYV